MNWLKFPGNCSSVLADFLRRLSLFKTGGYSSRSVSGQAWHDGNGHSHLQATLLGPSLTVPIADQKPVLGTWQQIFHLECDIKPRRRTIVVTVSGE